MLDYLEEDPRQLWCERGLQLTFEGLAVCVFISCDNYFKKRGYLSNICIDMYVLCPNYHSKPPGALICKTLLWKQPGLPYLEDMLVLKFCTRTLESSSINTT